MEGEGMSTKGTPESHYAAAMLDLSAMNIALVNRRLREIVRDDSMPERNPINDIPERRCNSGVNHAPHFHRRLKSGTHWCPGRDNGE